MLSLPLTEKRRQTEWKTIQTIGQNNNFPNTHIARLKTQIQQAHIRTTKDENNKNGQHSHSKAQKSESLQTSLNTQT